jgi:hypothetical protein
MQHQPQRKPADAGADDQNFHCILKLSSLTPLKWAKG